MIHEIFFLLLGMALGGVCMWLYGRTQLLRQQAAAEARLHEELSRRQQDDSARIEALRRELRAVSAETLAVQGSRLRQTHMEQLQTLLSPLEKDLSRFRQQFTETHASMKQQVEDLFKETLTLGHKAETLAKALTAESKQQGDWGEVVLRNILEASGLTEGRDFEVQVRTPDAEGSGGVRIPDVVVHLPEGRNVIIDSKVSLTAFTRYTAATDKAEAELQLKEHVRSVRAHVRELSRKDYGRVVEGSIGYVLMFMPNESAYVAAVNADPMLTTDAYREHVIVLNPTNLLMALQLAYNLWQTQLRESGVKDIYASAERLYRKFTLFAGNFVKVGEQISRLEATYEQSRRQLCQGRDNIVSQLERWRDKGLMPSARIPDSLTEECTETEPPTSSERP